MLSETDAIPPDDLHPFSDRVSADYNWGLPLRKHTPDTMRRVSADVVK